VAYLPTTMASSFVYFTFAVVVPLSSCGRLHGQFSLVHTIVKAKLPMQSLNGSHGSLLLHILHKRILAFQINGYQLPIRT
jgi:hypothetical protein